MSLSSRSLVVLSLVLVMFASTIFIDFQDQILSALGAYLMVQDNLHPADVIHVIAGDDYRTYYAIRLFKQGYAKKLFFTGGWCTKHNYFHGQHALQLALDAGIPREAISFDDSDVLSTYDEVMLLDKYLKEQQPSFQSVIVVSDAFHMRRAQWTYRKIFGKSYSIILAPVPIAQTRFKINWWTDYASTSYVKEEYIKIVYYFFRYQLNIHWLSRYDKF